MKAYGKSWGYNVYDCRYCLYRKGKLKGCVYPDGCCCPVPQKPARRNGIEQVYDAAADNAAPVSECEGCPYGRAAPCIGWCTKEVMRAAGLPKERDRSRMTISTVRKRNSSPFTASPRCCSRRNGSEAFPQKPRCSTVCSLTV